VSLVPICEFSQRLQSQCECECALREVTKHVRVLRVWKAPLTRNRLNMWGNDKSFLGKPNNLLVIQFSGESDENSYCPNTDDYKTCISLRSTSTERIEHGSVTIHSDCTQSEDTHVDTQDLQRHESRY
jgi:hypothetical protein